MADPPERARAERPLREAMLSGRAFARQRDDLTGGVAAFGGNDVMRALIAWFGADALRDLATGAGLLRGALDRDIAAIDAMIATQLDTVLHHARLARLEGSWRGLAWLIGGAETGPRLAVRVLPVAWAEICRDLERAAEFDASVLFRRIYEDEFGTPGGRPFGLLIIDHEVRHRPGPGAPTDDVNALKSLAAVAAAAFVPTVLGAAPALLDCADFAALDGLADPAAPLRDAEHARWRTLYAQEDTRFLGVTLPRLLARPPWPDDPARGGLRYREQADDAAQRVWMNAGYAVAALAARAHAGFGWPADIRGARRDEESGGVITGLMVEAFDTDPDEIWTRHPLELQFTDRQERALVEAGLMPLAALPRGPEALLPVAPSLQAARRYVGRNAEAADANARLSTQLNSLLCVARFAHYVKMMGRDMVGVYRTHDEIEARLEKWLSGYVNSNLSAGSETRARYPLVAGRVTVQERPGRPGVFGCTVHLQPHHQLDNVAAVFRLTTDIVARGQAA